MGEPEATAALKTMKDSSLPSPEYFVAIFEHLHLDRAEKQQQNDAFSGGIEALEVKSENFEVCANGDVEGEDFESRKKVDSVVNGGIVAGEGRNGFGGDSEGLEVGGDGEIGENVEVVLDERKDVGIAETKGVGGVESVDFGMGAKSWAQDVEREWLWPSRAVDERVEETEETVYPLRAGKIDCAYYMKTGKCAYGSNCRFNHPPRTPTSNQTAQEKGAEDFLGKVGHIECKYYLTPGGCKYGKSCKYEHLQEKIETQAAMLNSLGFPIRPGVKDCPYYMRNGACKFSVNCCFNHPDRIAMAGQNYLSGHLDGGPLHQNSPLVPISPSTPDQQSPKISASQSSSSEGTTNLPVALPSNIPPIPTVALHSNITRMLFPPIEANLTSASQSNSSEETTNPPVALPSNIPPNPSVALPSNIPRTLFPSIEANLTSAPEEYLAPASTHLPTVSKTEQTPYVPSDETTIIADCAPGQQEQLDFPERAGQPECPFIMKTGSCKFKAQCKFHHPVCSLSKASNISPCGLPLRPDQPICPSYCRFGICKYGPACKFDHPVDFHSSATGATRSYRDIVDARVL